MISMQNNNKLLKGVFECQQNMENCVDPKKNNVESIKIVLDALAEHHASDLTNIKEPLNSSEYNLKDITDVVTSMEFFKQSMDSTTLNQSINILQTSINKLLVDSNLFVRGIGWSLAKNVQCLKTKNGVSLEPTTTKILPPAYDALLCIFALSDEKFRQKHFENLVEYYFDSLITSLRQLDSDIAENITRSYCELQVRILLPVVKFEVASLLKLNNNLQNTQDLLKNILHFLKYPIINQEDVYEATRAKLGSDNYDLLDFSLISLTEKNGHLGEYYHLNIKIKTEEGDKELKLFAKFLINSTDFSKEIAENGPAKKEDFFYKKFIPLCIEQGLEGLLDFAPQCYLSRINWLLVLDDLSQQGYIGLKPNQVLQYEGLSASIRNMSKLHACTLILEEKMSKESEKTVRFDDLYGEYTEETLFIYAEDNPLKPLFDNTAESLIYVANKFPEVTQKLNLSEEELGEKLNGIFFSVFQKLKKSQSIRNVVSHGDMYVANMLFKFNENKVVTEGLLIDFQMLRYISPNFDLLFFIFENSTKETRDKYFNKLTEDYYDSLSENLIKFDLDPSKVFPKETFDKDIKFMMSAAVTTAFMYGHLCHIDPELRVEIFHNQEKMDYYLYNHKIELIELSWENESYRNILKGIIEDIVNLI